MGIFKFYQICFYVSKMCFSRECFTADFLQFLRTNVKIFRLYGRMCTYFQFKSFRGFSSNFWFPEKFYIAQQLVMRVINSLFGYNNPVTFYLLWRKITLKHDILSKIFWRLTYYFFLLGKFMGIPKNDKLLVDKSNTFS